MQQIIVKFLLNAKLKIKGLSASVCPSGKDMVFTTASVISGVSLVLSTFVPVTASAAAQSIKTTNANCVAVNINQYSTGDFVWVDVNGFDPNTVYAWSITGQPGSADPSTIVASGNATTDVNGELCFNTNYDVKSDDSGVYKVAFDNKNDNYTVRSIVPDPVQCFAAPVTVVTPSNTQGWNTADTRSNGSVTYVNDATSPAPTGALSLVTGAATGSPLQDKAQYMHAVDSLPLSQVSKLCYYTKQNSASFADGAPSYQLVVYLNGGTSGFTTFVYEPYNNGFHINQGTWQSWDVSAGSMWSSKSVTCSNGSVIAGGGGAPFYTLSQITTMCPDAVVAGFGVNVGSNNPNWDTEVDYVQFNNNLYNFELDPVLTSNVKVCKVDSNKNPLSGWDVFLKGDLIETVNVDSNASTGANSVNALEAGKKYVVEVTGTWQNRGFETVDASFTTPDSWTTVLDAPQGGYPDNLLELQVNNNFVNWGPYSLAHKYSYIYTGGGASANFRVFDGDVDTNTVNSSWYGDNVGQLQVKIYKAYAGVTTNIDGCATLTNVPYGNYVVSEIMQPGWANVSGNNVEVLINKAQSEFVLVNRCTTEACAPQTVDPKIHFMKVVCQSYSSINGNEAADSYDHTPNKNYTQFANFTESGFVTNYLVNGFVDPSEIPGKDSGCGLASGWGFLLSTDQDQHNDNQIVTTDANGVYTTNVSSLPQALSSGIRNGNFWVSEVEKKGYDFGAIRCYNDALNGDNLELINIGNSNPADIYCIAYNVEQIKPCVVEPINVVSGTTTKFLGLKEGVAPVDLKAPGNYPGGVMDFAVEVGPTGFPGAWDGSINSPDLSGAKYVSNSITQPTVSGGAGFDGSVDSWRLFSHTFTVPAGAVNISTPSLHFAADNEVAVYLDETLIGTSSSFSNSTTVGPLSSISVAPGTHTLKFAVKNYAFDQTNNPTGVIYKLDTINYDCGSTGGGSNKFSISGKIYEDLDESNSNNSGDNPLNGWTVKLDNVATETDENTTTTSDSNGNYIFENLDAGCYLVSEVLPSGWAQTEPAVDTHTYQVAIGGVNNCDAFNGESSIIGFFAKTAHAAAVQQQLAFAGNASGINFGNFDIPSGNGGGSGGNGGNGGGSGGSGSGGTPPADPGTPTNTGRVLGDSTNIPSDSISIPTPRVLGAETTLPRTGLPLNIIIWFVSTLAATYCVYSLISKKLSKN